MKAMVLHNTERIEGRPLKYEDVDVPSPGRGEVLVRITSVGVCHSNLHIIEGDWRKYGTPAKLPIIPGHEVIGTIAELGGDVEGYHKGQLVGIQPIWNTCGRCEYCITGRENLCEEAQVTGETVDGGYAEYIVGKAAHIYAMPDNLDPVTSAPLFCPGVTAYRATKLADPSPGREVFVMGVGGVGHLVIQFAKLYGSRVTAVTTSKDHEALALEVGADEVIIADRDYRNLKGSYGRADSVIVFAPSQPALDAAPGLLKNGGIMVQGVFGGISDFQFTREIQIRGSVVGPRSDMNDVLKLASASRIRIVAKSYPLEQANDVLLMLKQGRINGRAVLVP